MKVSADKAPNAEVQKVHAQRQNAALSARERREALKAQRGSKIETIQIEGEDWHIKLLDWPGYMLASILLGRDSAGRIRAGEVDILRALTVVALHCGVASGPNDDTPYFSQEEAHEWASEPGTLVLAGQLFAAVTARNPELSLGNALGATTKNTSSSSPAKKPRKSPTS